MSMGTSGSGGNGWGSAGTIVCINTHKPYDQCYCSTCVTNKRFEDLEKRIADLEKFIQLAKYEKCLDCSDLDIQIENCAHKLTK